VARITPEQFVGNDIFVGPVRIALTGAFLMLAMGGLGTPHRARQIACRAERSHATVNAAG